MDILLLFCHFHGNSDAMCQTSGLSLSKRTLLRVTDIPKLSAVPSPGPPGEEREREREREKVRERDLERSMLTVWFQYVNTSDSLAYRLAGM